MTSTSNPAEHPSEPAASPRSLRSTRGNRPKTVLECRSTDQVLVAVPAQNWSQERWTAKRGPAEAQEPITNAKLLRPLSNVLYIGQVRYAGKAYPARTAEAL